MTALELIFEAAEGPLTWQADVAWLVRGVAPKAWLERYRSRLTSAHVKDLAPTGQNRRGRLGGRRLGRARLARPVAGLP